jgi:uncharacterized protein involved in exopolysaccharide biosynthesis
MANKEPGYNFSSVDLLIYLWEKRWILISVSILAAIVSIIAAFLITPKFKSTVVLFPAFSKSILVGNYGERNNLYGFGEEEQAEQLLQILNSDRIRDRIIDKYNLMEHYQVVEDSKYPLTTLYNVYKSNISFRQTEFMSILIEVMDKDPQMAADIANDIAALVDTVFYEIKRERAVMAYNIVEEEYTETKNNISIFKDSLRVFGELGINDYYTQADRSHEGYTKSIRDGNMNAARRLKDEMDVLTKYGGAYLILRGKLQSEINILENLTLRLKEARVEVNSTLNHTFIVDKAYKSDKKAYPKKSIIVILSTIGAFLLTFILLIVNDSIRTRIEEKRR